jgi:DNA integrity scanning protein DisA with diadenylate cyclase activity
LINYIHNFYFESNIGRTIFKTLIIFFLVNIFFYYLSEYFHFTLLYTILKIIVVSGLIFAFKNFLKEMQRSKLYLLAFLFSSIFIFFEDNLIMIITDQIVLILSFPFLFAELRQFFLSKKD